jgi:hypothetical protein
MSFLKFNQVQTIGRINYPIDNVELTRLYLNETPKEDIINEFKGGYILMTNNTLTSLRFDSHVLFFKKFDNHILENILILYHKFMLVQFRNEKYFEIYDIYTGDLILKQEFRTKIKFILCKTINDYIVDLKEVECTDLFVVLEKSELHLISLKNLDLQLSTLLTIPASGIECFDCFLNGNEDEFFTKNNKILCKYILSLNI